MIPKIPAGWIYGMVTLGFIGSFIIFSIILMAAYFTFNILKRRTLAKPLIVLNFTIWTGNLLACIGWATLPTNLFYNITHQSCIIIYIFNYLCYMIAKLCIHILLLYRLFVAFKGSVYQINVTFIKTFIVVITITFCVFTSLWIKICIAHVTIGIAEFDPTLKICTLYNNYSNLHMNIYDEIWPILFGGQDLLIGSTTLVIFLKKLSDISTTSTSNNLEAETLIRKLSILGSMAICSTFIFYTFAVPFTPNLTFLLPFDATLNSLCIVLLLEYSHSMYIRLCCCMDTLLKKSLHHQTKDEMRLASIHMTNSPNTMVSIHRNIQKPQVTKLDDENGAHVKQTIDMLFNRNKSDLSLRIRSSTSMKHITSFNKRIDELNLVNLKPLPPMPLADSKYSRSAFL